MYGLKSPQGRTPVLGDPDKPVPFRLTHYHKQGVLISHHCPSAFTIRSYMIRFSTAGESHGEALMALVSGLPAGVPVDLEFVNRELVAAAAGLWPRRAHEDRDRQGARAFGSAARQDHRLADCDRDHQPRLEELGRKAAGGGGRSGQAPGGCFAAARSCGPGRRAEVQLSRCAVCAGAGVGARVDQPRGGRRVRQADAADAGHRSAEPRDPRGARGTGARRELGRDCRDCRKRTM